MLPVWINKLYLEHAIAHAGIKVRGKNNSRTLYKFVSIYTISQLTVDVTEGIGLLEIDDIHWLLTLCAKLEKLQSGTEFNDRSFGPRIVVKDRDLIVVLGSGIDHIYVEPAIATAPSIAVSCRTIDSQVIWDVWRIKTTVVGLCVVGSAVIGYRSTLGISFRGNKIRDRDQDDTVAACGTKYAGVRYGCAGRTACAGVGDAFFIGIIDILLEFILGVY